MLILSASRGCVLHHPPDYARREPLFPNIRQMPRRQIVLRACRAPRMNGTLMDSTVPSTNVPCAVAITYYLPKDYENAEKQQIQKVSPSGYGFPRGDRAIYP